MALVDATTFKAQMANVATAVTAAWKDTTATKVADEIADPHHPLRDLQNLLSFDPSTGVVSSNDTYIDAVYAGDNYARSTREFQTQTEPVVDPGIVSAAVETGTPTQIDIVLNKEGMPTPSGASSIAVSVDATQVAINSISIEGTTMTIVLAAAITAGQVVLIDSGQVKFADLSTYFFSSEAVTNNVV